MSTAISHRGPDGAGSLVRENVALGHRRLSIIDLEGGRQPMATPDGQVHLTYNGEVYNYRELRRALEQKGYQFRTESDTEVILYAYEAWGKRCVEHFEGMFAFAIADFRKRELFLARDPFGIKPLLYRVDEKSFAFASEFLALQQLPDWTGEIDLYAIDLYLRYQYIPAPHTAFRKVFKLPAGHRMTVRMGESFHRLERYWEPDFSHKRRIRQHELIEELDNALRDSVRRHLVSDVPFGALLSGGVDSSLVVGYMSEILNHPVKTFSIGFEDESVNELHYARSVAKKYGTEHHEEIVRFDALEMLPEIVKHHGEPFGDQSAIPTWAVSRLARSEVPMVLSGDGGDELFAGYNWYGSWLNRVSNGQTFQKQSRKSRFKRVVKSFLFNQRPVPVGEEGQVINWLDQITRFQSCQRERLWNPDLRFLSDCESQTLSRSFADASDAPGVNRVQRVDLETYLPENILRKVDIASMRYGLEVRPPILDLKFFKAASSIPTAMLYGGGVNGGAFFGKIPLKQLAAKKFGEEFASRTKQGFVLPLHAWLRNSPQNLRIVQERLLHSHSHIRNWFDIKEVENIVVSGNPENLWLLLTLEEWSQQFIKGKSAGELIYA
jgi:asparagine synthase (glutamine-hydrolysing)